MNKNTLDEILKGGIKREEMFVIGALDNVLLPRLNPLPQMVHLDYNPGNESTYLKDSFKNISIIQPPCNSIIKDKLINRLKSCSEKLLVKNIDYNLNDDGTIKLSDSLFYSKIKLSGSFGTMNKKLISSSLTLEVLSNSENIHAINDINKHDTFNFNLKYKLKRIHYLVNKIYS